MEQWRVCLLHCGDKVMENNTCKILCINNVWQLVRH